MMLRSCCPVTRVATGFLVIFLTLTVMAMILYLMYGSVERVPARHYSTM